MSLPTDPARTVVELPTDSPLAASVDRTAAGSDGDDLDRRVLAQIWPALLGDGPADGRGLDPVVVTGPRRTLPSVYEVDALAAATVAAATAAVAELQSARSGRPARAVTVDRRHAALAFRRERHLAAVGWELPGIWDPIAGDYQTADGWIRLHTNYSYHRDAAVAVLGVPADRDAVTRAVRTWSGDDLESSIVAAGGCAAAMRTAAQWRIHPQGQAVAAEPLVAVRTDPAAAPADLDGPAAATADRSPRPLAGIRVLDLTRVIAGPVCTSVLAAYGADVVRVDPPGFEEVGALLGDTTAGKRRAALDLRRPAGRDDFVQLVAGAHLVVHGYRSDALAALGFTTAELRRINPAVVVVSHDAYGWTGPWATRRGFDSLVQMSCGIADRGREAHGGTRPVPLPAQALDHGTGFLLAAAAARALTRLVTSGVTSEVRLSLARTAGLLAGLGDGGDAFAPEVDAADVEPWLEDAATDFGPVRRLRLPGQIEGTDPSWPIPAGPLGTHPGLWPPQSGRHSE